MNDMRMRNIGLALKGENVVVLCRNHREATRSFNRHRDFLDKLLPYADTICYIISKLKIDIDDGGSIQFTSEPNGLTGIRDEHVVYDEMEIPYR